MQLRDAPQEEHIKVLLTDGEVDLCLLIRAYFIRKNYALHMANTITDGVRPAYEYQPEYIYPDPRIPHFRANTRRQLKEAASNARIVDTGT